MDAEQPQVTEAVVGMMAQKAARYWWVALLSGVAWLLIAWVVLRMNVSSLATVGVLIGCVFLVSAVNEAALAQAVTGGWKVVHYGVSAAFVLAAVWAFVRPINTFFALASILGLLLFLQGVITLARGIALNGETPHWWLDLVTGGLLILLAIWVSSSDGVWNLQGRASFILLWVGFMAVFRAISDVMLAFALRRLRDGGVAAGPPPAVPAQERRTPADVPQTATP
jgi:uncharacterized membrane protein HdeD (DUF308 family)